MKILFLKENADHLFLHIFGMEEGAIFAFLFAYIRALWEASVFILCLLQKCCKYSLYPLCFATHPLTQNLWP